MLKLMMVFCCLLTFSSVAKASEDVSIRCTAASAEECKKRVTKELESRQCGVVADSVICQEQEEGSDKGAFYCLVNTASCTDTSSDGFTGVTCEEGQKKVSIKDRKLSATWARTIFWVWVRSVCKG